MTKSAASVEKVSNSPSHELRWGIQYVFGGTEMEWTGTHTKSVAGWDDIGSRVLLEEC